MLSHRFRLLVLVLTICGATSAAATTPVVQAAAEAIAPNCLAQTQIDVAKIKSQIILVGEWHGTTEIPEFVSALSCSLLRSGKAVILAVERVGEEQEGLSRYLESQGTDADRIALLQGERWTSKWQDGRASQAMLALIEDVRRWHKSGQRVGLLAIQRNESMNVTGKAEDIPPLSPEDSMAYNRINDRAMADNLLAASILYRDYSIVALTGMAHTSTLRGNGRDTEYLPMGNILSSLAPTFIIGVTSSGGTGWFSGSAGYKLQPVRAGNLFKDGSRIDAIVHLPVLTGSPSAIAQPAIAANKIN